MDRPKMGFGMPMAGWLRHELRPWAESMLVPDRLTGAGLKADPVTKAWRAHLNGADRFQEIWTILMWLQWQEEWRTGL